MGEYASASKMVRDAMRLWNQRRAFRTEELRLLRDAWDSCSLRTDRARLWE